MGGKVSGEVGFGLGFEGENEYCFATLSGKKT